MIVYRKGGFFKNELRNSSQEGRRIVRLDNDSEAKTNVTFNYSDLLAQAFGDPNGIRILNRRKAENAVRLLQNAINNLSDDNTSPTVEELEAEIRACEQKNEAIKQEINATGAEEYRIFVEINESYIDSLERRLRTADPVTGRALPSSWDSTPYNTKKALT